MATVLLWISLFITLPSAQCEKPVVGKTYDNTNYQEIQEYLIHSLELYLKNGETVCKIGEINDSMELDAGYLEQGARNKGKFDVNAEGILVEKGAGKIPEYFQGQPFPVLDENDPKMVNKLMYNFYFGRHRWCAMLSIAESKFVGQGGLERAVTSAGFNLFYYNRFHGPMPNPNGFLNQTITGVVAPYDLRGTSSMAWTYNDEKEDTAFAYVPMLRRVRRTSAAARSDPFLGGDGCTDDMYGYGGKIAAMKHKYLGKKEILVQFVTDRIDRWNEFPDGSRKRTFHEPKKGYETPGWQGTTWALTDSVWVVRPVYVTEIFPKDPYYNYGRQILYIDQDQIYCYVKVVYDRAGEFWKTIWVNMTYQKDSQDRGWMVQENFQQIDSRVGHAGVSDVKNLLDQYGYDFCPVSRANADMFTTTALIQMSK